jgi:hypothetical protein
VRGIVDPLGMASAFGATPPNYPSLIRLWQGLVLMFGCMVAAGAQTRSHPRLTATDHGYGSRTTGHGSGLGTLVGLRRSFVSGRA